MGLGYIPPPQGSTEKLLAYHETRTGTPAIQQVWQMLTEEAAWMLTLLPFVTLRALTAHFFPGIVAGVFLDISSFWLFGSLLVKSMPKYDPYQRLGFRLFSWTLAQEG